MNVSRTSDAALVSRLQEIARAGLGKLTTGDFLELTQTWPVGLPEDTLTRLQIIRMALLRQHYRLQAATDVLQELVRKLERLETVERFLVYCESVKLMLILNQSSESIDYLLKAESLLDAVPTPLHGHFYYAKIHVSLYLFIGADPDFDKITDEVLPPEYRLYEVMWNEGLKNNYLALRLTAKGHYEQAIHYNRMSIDWLRINMPDGGAILQLEVNQLQIRALHGERVPEEDFQRIRSLLNMHGNTRLLTTLAHAQGTVAENLGKLEEAHHHYQWAFENIRQHQDFSRATLNIYDWCLPFYNRWPDSTPLNELWHLRINLADGIRDRALSLLQQLLLHATHLQHTQNELKLLNTDLVNRLALVGEYRDELTGLHTRRVGQLSYEIASLLNVPYAKELRDAARLHDLGKVSLPDSILLSTAALTPEERQTMQSHTTRGAEILDHSESKVLQLTHLVARSHHERWDGTGYPDGLKGEDIPIYARIVSVADVFDALTSVRPYKRAWTVEEALREIECQSGSQFDAAVVRGLIAVLENGSEWFSMHTRSE